MGKYMRKSKTSGEVVVSQLGVLTRAKTLALQKLTVSPVSPDTGDGGDGGSYLQLRSRRLIKPFSVLEVKGHKNGVPKDTSFINPNPSQSPDVNSEEGVKDCLGDKEMENQKNSCCGDNMLEFEGRKRTTRENTPCSLIGDSDTNIQTPGSSTRHNKSSKANSRVLNLTRTHIPTAHEMDEFFTGAEEQQQRQFIEKYNFDPVNEKPLPGRYEWVKVDC